MDGIADSLRLGWDALLLKEEAYERMSIAANPVVKGLILIVIVGVVIALAAFIGDVLEWASTPNLGQIQDTVFHYLMRMPWWEEAVSADPSFPQYFEQWYDWGWGFATALSPSPGGAAASVILTPLGLIFRWLIYGLLAYLFARWLGGTADLSETLGVLALAVAPQMLNLLTLLPYVQMGNLVSIWGILCAYVGLKTVHRLSWSRAVWATLLPFILAFGVIVLAGCFGMAVLTAVVKGG